MWDHLLELCWPTKDQTLKEDWLFFLQKSPAVHSPSFRGGAPEPLPSMWTVDWLALVRFHTGNDSWNLWVQWTWHVYQSNPHLSSLTTASYSLSPSPSVIVPEPWEEGSRSSPLLFKTLPLYCSFLTVDPALKWQGAPSLFQHELQLTTVWSYIITHMYSLTNSYVFFHAGFKIKVRLQPFMASCRQCALMDALNQTR